MCLIKLPWFSSTSEEHCWLSYFDCFPEKGRNLQNYYFLMPRKETEDQFASFEGVNIALIFLDRVQLQG